MSQGHTLQLDWFIIVYLLIALPIPNNTPIRVVANKAVCSRMITIKMLTHNT